MSRPICSVCEVEMRASKNGVGTLYYSGYDPYKIVEGDEYSCPNCNHTIITGLSTQSLHKNMEPEAFESSVARHTDNSSLRHVRDYFFGKVS